jgi:hypothetical protein
MMLYMNTSAAPSSRLDRFVDLLLDSKHPFWKDERQRSVYNEAATAALMLQTLLTFVVGTIGLLVGGVKVLGIVTAMVLCGTVSQFLIMAILTRRHVDLFPAGWQKHTSKSRKTVIIALSFMYAGSVFFVMLTDGTDWSRSGVAGLVVGGLAGAGVTFALVHYFKRKMAR